MIKVIIDPVIFSLQKKGGISRLIFHIQKSLKKDFMIIEANNSFFKQKFTKVSILFPVLIKNHNNSIFFSSYLSYPFFNFKGAFVIIIHDCMNELFASNLKSIYIRFLNKMCLKRATGIIYVSNQTKKDYETFYPSSKNVSSVVIPNPLISQIRNKKNFNHENYLIFIGSRSASYKNFKLSVLVANELKIELRIIGGGNLRNDELFFLKKHDVNFSFTGYLTDEEVEHNYLNATALLYLSSYEGFGLPIIEAQALGCPVITCIDAKGVKETADGSTLEINENFSDEDITKIKLLINSIDYRKEICEKGFQNIKKYNYEETYLMYKDFLIKQYDFINNSNI